LDAFNSPPLPAGAFFSLLLKAVSRAEKQKNNALFRKPQKLQFFLRKGEFPSETGAPHSKNETPGNLHCLTPAKRKTLFPCPGEDFSPPFKHRTP